MDRDIDDRKEVKDEGKEEIPLKELEIGDKTRKDIRTLKLIAAGFIGVPLFIFFVALFLLSLFG